MIELGLGRNTDHVGESVIDQSINSMASRKHTETGRDEIL
jgi:hypothetical protein